ncbi:MAG: methionyl-tRNA formyltransferase [Bacteroidetes bacterium]|nr:methionyl-tRNA formyltransferase [Bacteroidota bacterium]
MGTPEFAVETLDLLLQNNYNVVGVITVPDKPAGRGQQLQQSAVKKYALEKGLNILQPEKLKDENFLQQLDQLKADLQIVVAFRMLPEKVWNMPPMGTINLHGSLLPNYRGAAPINWAIINGEIETGVSTFFLQQEIDTGKIIFQERTPIGENETAGEIHDKLMRIGAQLVLKTVYAIENDNYPQIDQSDLITADEPVKNAPKIFKIDCRIDWNKSVDEIHNQIRGLSPYPAAFTDFVSPDGKIVPVKIFRSRKENATHNLAITTIITDSKSYIKIVVKRGYILLDEIQIAGKKKMAVDEFLRGFQLKSDWKVN